MTAPPQSADRPDPDPDLLARIKGTNISEQTLLATDYLNLATDYLNHFNEVVMLIEMIPDMAECLEDAQAWQPKTYQQHFLDSGLSDGALAAAAYEQAPARFRAPFDATVDQLNRLVAATLPRLAAALTTGNPDVVAGAARTASRQLQGLIDAANATIHGATETMAQADVDTLLDDPPPRAG